jgi:hypothetical protein
MAPNPTPIFTPVLAHHVLLTPTFGQYPTPYDEKTIERFFQMPHRVLVMMHNISLTPLQLLNFWQNYLHPDDLQQLSGDPTYQIVRKIASTFEHTAGNLTLFFVKFRTALELHISALVNLDCSTFIASWRGAIKRLRSKYHDFQLLPDLLYLAYSYSSFRGAHFNGPDLERTQCPHHGFVTSMSTYDHKACH